ncbi:MAG: PAS domain S-box protein, partial [Candidatus Poribacteria bacterium]|nr:PAS domain S-box protein [Candidatus Poribacteria bacterium]
MATKRNNILEEDSIELLRELLANAPVHFYLTNGEGQFRFANDAALDALGRTFEEFVGKGWEELGFPAELMEPIVRLREQVMMTRRAAHAETHFPTVDGDRFFNYLLFPVVSGDGEVYAVGSLVRDVTGWMHDSIAELRDSEERFRATFEQAAVGIAHVGSEGRWLRVNETLAQMLGYERDELLTLSLPEVTHPDDLSIDATQLSRLFRKESRHYSVQKRLICRDGSRIWVLMTVSVVWGDDGSPKYAIAVIRDISERKRTEDDVRQLNDELEARVAQRTIELNRAVDQLRQSNEELERFAYIASHDLQEPLRKVQTFGELLAEEFADRATDTETDYLNRMRASAARMQMLIQDLLQLSRVSSHPIRHQPIDLNQIAQDVLSDLQSRIESSGGEVVVEPLPTVHADRVQMHQLLQNLISNALKFRRADAPPRVRVYRDESEIDAGVCAVMVEDNGIGFEMSYFQRILLPFERLHTRGEFEGTGMGLAICRRIVERHRGSITAESALGVGTTFRVV